MSFLWGHSHFRKIRIVGRKNGQDKKCWTSFGANWFRMIRNVFQNWNHILVNGKNQNFSKKIWSESSQNGPKSCLKWKYWFRKNFSIIFLDWSDQTHEIHMWQQRCWGQFAHLGVSQRILKIHMSMMAKNSSKKY